VKWRENPATAAGAALALGEPLFLALERDAARGGAPKRRAAGADRASAGARQEAAQWRF
jgi:hypothetical protein